MSAVMTNAIESCGSKRFAASRKRLSCDERIGKAVEPRINLRKRSVESLARAPMNLCTVNSAFLSGLLQDINSSSHESEPQEQEPATADENDDQCIRKVEEQPQKKIRISNARGLANNGKSFKNLRESVDIYGNTTTQRSDLPRRCSGLEREDSLHLQLHCVSASSSSNSANEASAKTVDLAAKLAFPRLSPQVEDDKFPATVSISSCTALTPVGVDIATSHVDASQRDGYGWFVEVDDDDVGNVRNNCERDTSSCGFYNKNSDLAFSAPTAPKASNHDAEVEWARAADTVDDVLGDLF